MLQAHIPSLLVGFFIFQDRNNWNLDAAICKEISNKELVLEAVIRAVIEESLQQALADTLRVLFK